MFFKRVNSKLESIKSTIMNIYSCSHQILSRLDAIIDSMNFSKNDKSVAFIYKDSELIDKGDVVDLFTDIRKSEKVVYIDSGYGVKSYRFNTKENTDKLSFKIMTFREY